MVQIPIVPKNIRPIRILILRKLLKESCIIILESVIGWLVMNWSYAGL